MITLYQHRSSRRQLVARVFLSRSGISGEYGDALDGETRAEESRDTKRSARLRHRGRGRMSPNDVRWTGTRAVKADPTHPANAAGGRPL